MRSMSFRRDSIEVSRPAAWHRERDSREFVGAVGRSTRVADERVAGGAGKVQCRGQRTQGFAMWASPFSTLQSAHGMDGEAGDRRELLLRVTGAFPETSKLRPEGLLCDGRRPSITCLAPGRPVATSSRSE
jgi:hypothetical protein